MHEDRTPEPSFNILFDGAISTDMANWCDIDPFRDCVKSENLLKIEKATQSAI